MEMDLKNWRLTNKIGVTYTYAYIKYNQLEHGYYFEMIKHEDFVKIIEIYGNDENVIFDGVIKNDDELLFLEKILALKMN